jgi:beta-lactamase regulating signal transducer with metallopeptidase domain
MNTLIQAISSSLQHAAFTAPFLDAWLKSLVVLAVAAGLCLLLPRAAAATRHWIWFMAVASLPCLLLLACLPHSWHRPLWSVSASLSSGNQVSLALNIAPVGGAANSVSPVSPAGIAAATASGAVSRGNQPIAARLSAFWLAVAFVLWLTGAALGLASVLAGHVRLTRLARRGLPLQTADWALLLRQAGDALRLRRPVSLWQSADNLMPLTWGWRRPVVLLPAEAAHWPLQRRRVVLLHELAHVKRWDCLTQTVARIVRALYWVNPLVWLATRQMCVERERACDDLVLNGGCKASDYATQLVEIAQAYRQIPQVAAIAMARSSQIKGRVAAIVDASRARRSRPLTAITVLVFMGAFIWSVGGSSPVTSRDQAEAFRLRQQQIARLQAFAQAKEQQSRELAAKAGEQITPEFQRFFDAATRGDWQTVTNRFEYFKLHHPQYHSIHGTNGFDPSLRTAYWQPVLELCLAYDHVALCDPKYTALYADAIIDSIPAGSIYFGGTDPGRGVPTAFCKSSINAAPFFVLTQNALADGTYLDYLRAMYGGKIYTLTGEDSQRCFQEYMTDAMSRLQEHKLKPGEDVKMVDGKVVVAGQVAVMSINGLITKVIFDRNPDREFYVEESFPLDWMNPYLEPHGLIMKLNRQPLAQLPEDTIARDHDYWRKLVAGMLGEWLDERTTARDVVSFVDRVYVRHDLKEFTGDPGYLRNEYASKTFSKLRCSIAGVYAWRLKTAPAPKYGFPPSPRSPSLVTETEIAFCQAFALCPYNPEVLFRYVNWLVPVADPAEFRKFSMNIEGSPIVAEIFQQRLDGALLLTETFLKLDPKNAKAQELLETLKSYKTQQGQSGDATNKVVSLEEQARAGTLTAAQAQALALRLANEKAQALYHRQPFRDGPPAQWVQGQWVWQAEQGQGTLDIEAIVKFAQDGTNPDVNVRLLDSRPSGTSGF